MTRLYLIFQRRGREWFQVRTHGGRDEAEAEAKQLRALLGKDAIALRFVQLPR